MTAAVALDGASVRFGATVALDHVDLSVAPGEVLTVLGPSGSGKSTALRAIAGLQRLDAGRVLLAGRDVTDVPPHRRAVGLMFQDHALFPHRDVAGNVAFGLRMQHRPAREIRRRVAELLELVDLAGFERRSVQTLSGGEQQRVALARALAPEPEVLLLDEPLGALDASLRQRLVGELRALFTRLELTVIAVTHDQSEAFALGDRVAVVDRGRILQTGRPAELWHEPASARVARLLGFANVAPVEVAQGRAATPWGPVAVPGAPDGPATVVVRPEGVRVAAEGGGVPGRVVAAAFRGDRTALRIELDGAPPLDALVPSTGAPAPGAVVSVVLDPAGVVLTTGGEPDGEAAAEPTG